MRTTQGGDGLLPRIRIDTRGRGLYDITDLIATAVHDGRIEHGLVVLFVPHTSASVVIQERADPTSRQDLEMALTAIVNKAAYERHHVAEGPDDSPSHLRTVLTGVSVIIPVEAAQMVLGDWQGVYLWEHRDAPRERTVFVRMLAC